MKFTIATIHSAYAFPFSVNGRDIATDLSQGNEKYSAAELNWLKPVEDFDNNTEILLEEGIEGLNNVSIALAHYFDEQFSVDKSRMLWMPSFHLNYLYYKDYLSTSIFDADNILSELVQNRTITEIEIIVLHLGKQSLINLAYPKSITEVLTDGIKITGHEVSEEYLFFDTLVRNYSLAMFHAEDTHPQNRNYLHLSSNEAFLKYGKLLNPYDAI